MNTTDSIIVIDEACPAFRHLYKETFERTDGKLRQFCRSIWRRLPITEITVVRHEQRRYIVVSLQPNKDIRQSHLATLVRRQAIWHRNAGSIYRDAISALLEQYATQLDALMIELYDIPSPERPADDE